jgi:hypothetical protein
LSELFVKIKNERWKERKKKKKKKRERKKERERKIMSLGMVDWPWFYIFLCFSVKQTHEATH